MRTVLTDKDVRDQELIRMWEEGVDEEALAETKRSNRQSFLAAAERVLTPQQFDTISTKYGEGGK